MALTEGLVLNGLDLNSSPTGVYGLEELDLTPPKKKSEWAEGSDSDGGLLIRPPRYEKRTVTAKVRIDPQTTMDTALEKLGAIIAQLQEAEKNPGGIPLEWIPAQATKKLTFYVLVGEIVGLPINVTGDLAGWFAKTPVLTLQMICKPFGYGVEEEVRSAVANETGLSIVQFTLAGIKGDVPAQGRLVIKDTAAVGRRWVEWGLQQRYYDAATSLILDSEDMVPVGGVQSTALNALGAYKRVAATNGSIATALLREPTICCTTGSLKHVGTFRVRARVQATLTGESLAQNVFLRLSYQDGEGPFRANDWVTPVAGNKLVSVDLGEITTTTAQAGTQKWLGRIEAFSENGVLADTLHVDYLELIPVGEGYGKARGVLPSAPGTVVAYDNFTTGTLSGSLNARTPAVGAAWATSGAATDWTVASTKATRATINDTEPRFGVLGGSIGSSRVTVVGVAPTVFASKTYFGALLRWTNSSNYAFAEIQLTSSGGATLVLGVRVAGVTTTLAQQKLASSGTFITAVNLTLTATLDGALTVATTAGGKPVELSGSNAAIATGGTLAAGLAGMYDRQTGGTVATRTVTSIGVSTLAAIPYCIQPSRTMEVRSDSALTTDSTGTNYGPVPLYRGSRFYIPAAGEAGRTSRGIVKADRNDLEESDQQTIADGLSVQVFATPRYVVVPD